MYIYAPRRRLVAVLPDVDVEVAKFVSHQDKRPKTSSYSLRPLAAHWRANKRWCKDSRFWPYRQIFVKKKCRRRFKMEGKMEGKGWIAARGRIMKNFDKKGKKGRFYNMLTINNLKIAQSLTANLGERNAKSLIENWRFSPLDLRSSSFSRAKTHEKSLQSVDGSRVVISLSP